MALCKQIDIEILRQVDVTAEPDTAVATLILMAQGLIEGECKRLFGDVTDEEVLVEDTQTVDTTVYLPHFPITALEITDPELGVLVVDVDYHLHPSGRVLRLGTGTGIYTWDWQYNIGTDVTHWRRGTNLKYSGGFDDPDTDEVPQDLRTLCAQVAGRLFDDGVISAEGGAGIQSETAGGWSVSYQAVIDDLSKSQKQILRRYRHKVPVVAF